MADKIPDIFGPWAQQERERLLDHYWSKTVPHPKTRSATPDDLLTAAHLGQHLKLSRGLLNPTGLREPSKEDARYWFANHHPIVEPYTWQDILWLQLDASTLMD